MKSERGFTLIELLFTLTVVAFIISLSVPFLIATFEKQKEKQFFTLLKQDILLLQNSTFRTSDYNRIFFRIDHYQIIFDSNKYESIIRQYPQHTSLMGNTTILNFKKDGTVIDPRTITLRSKYGNKDLVFPFGKGRFYVKSK